MAKNQLEMENEGVLFCTFEEEDHSLLKYPKSQARLTIYIPSDPSNLEPVPVLLCYSYRRDHGRGYLGGQPRQPIRGYNSRNEVSVYNDMAPHFTGHWLQFEFLLRSGNSSTSRYISSYLSCWIMNQAWCLLARKTLQSVGPYEGHDLGAETASSESSKYVDLDLEYLP